MPYNKPYDNRKKKNFLKKNLKKWNTEILQHLVVEVLLVVVRENLVVEVLLVVVSCNFLCAGSDSTFVSVEWPETL